MDSTPIHVTCKFARRYGKDCESEVHVNLDFRMPAIISEMAVVCIYKKYIQVGIFSHFKTCWNSFKLSIGGI